MSNESRVIDNPSIDDVFNLMKREASQSINCVQIGKIESFNSALNTASVSIVFKRKLKNGEEIPYPKLNDCPVFKLSGGGACIHMPITKGDYCLILFNDRCIDEWTLSGQVVAPTDTRCHDISDGIVLVGLLDPISATPSPSIPVINGGTKKIAIKNNIASLITIIESLIDAIKSITITVPPGPGAPTPFPVDATIQTNLESVKTQFGTLLDTGA